MGLPGRDRALCIEEACQEFAICACGFLILQFTRVCPQANVMRRWWETCMGSATPAFAALDQRYLRSTAHQCAKLSRDGGRNSVAAPPSASSAISKERTHVGVAWLAQQSVRRSSWSLY